MVSKGEMWVFDSSCITQPQSQISTDSIPHNCLPVTLRASLKYSCLHLCDCEKMVTLVVTLVVGWPHHSRKCRQLYFNDALSVTTRGSYELCCQSKFDSVAA